LDRSNSETAGKRCEYRHAGVHGSPGSASREARVDRDPNLLQALGNTAHRGGSRLDVAGSRSAEGAGGRLAVPQRAASVHKDTHVGSKIGAAFSD
ncbi:hypothetical protein T05_13802, partial [Trichinella murrelli]